MDIRKDFKNSLLNRRELEVVESYDSNPGFEKVKQDIAAKFDVPPDKIFISRIVSNFGTNEFLIEAFIYDSAEDMNKVQRKKEKKEKK